MINHIVIRCFKEQAGGRPKKRNAWNIRREVEKLKDSIPEIHLEAGIFSGKAGDMYDIASYAGSGTGDVPPANPTRPVHVNVDSLPGLYGENGVQPVMKPDLGGASVA